MATEIKDKKVKASGKKKPTAYSCQACGRVTPFRGAVCQPKVIR